MKINLILITLLASLRLMAMVPVEPQDNTDGQLAQISADYQQKWAEKANASSVDVLETKLNTAAAANKEEDSYGSEEEGSSEEELVPYSNNIIEMFLHNYPAYQRTYGSLPGDVSKLFARRVLDTIPTLKRRVEHCLAQPVDSLPMENYVHSWKTKYKVSYPPKPEGLPDAYFRPDPIYPVIPSPILATFDRSGNYIACINDCYHLEILQASNMKRIFSTSYHRPNLRNIMYLHFIGDSKIMALDTSNKAYIWNFRSSNTSWQQGSVKQPGFALIQRQIAQKKAFIAYLNADGVHEHDPLHGFKRFFEGREILDAHYDAANKILYALGKSRNGHRPLIEADSNHDYHEREIIVYDLKKAKILFHHFGINRGFWKSSPKISDCLCVHDATRQMFFHEEAHLKATKHIVDLRSIILEKESEQSADLHQIEEKDFMRNLTLDQAITLCILFQLKRQNHTINLAQYPHLKLNCSKLPKKIFYHFLVSKIAYNSDKTKIAQVVGYPAKKEGSCATQGCTIV